MSRIGDTIISHSSFPRNLGPSPPSAPLQQGYISQQVPKIAVPQSPDSFNVNDYIKYRYPFKIAILHVALLIFLNVVVIILETVLALKNSAVPNSYGGFWAGGVNLLVGVITIFSVCLRNYLMVAILAGLHFISIVISIIGLIIMTIFALSFYDNCSVSSSAYCTYSSAVAINWAIFSIGIASTLLSGVFFSVLMALIGGVFSKKSDYARK